MGTAALSDARSILSIAISHNMDNITSIDQEALAKYMGLTKNADGSAGATGAQAFCDASGSKFMKVDAPSAGHITYAYRRGGVTLIADIDVGSQKITWTQHGLTASTGGNTTGDDNRITALAQGLKLAQTGDLGAATNANSVFS